MALNRNQILKNAQTYLQRNKLDKAIAEYLLIVKEDPKDCRTLLKIAEIRLRKNEVEQACETYNQIAELYAADGFYLKAVAVYKQILKIDPQAIAVYHKLAEVYDQLGLVNDAITQFKTIIDLQTQRGDLKAALAACKRITQLDPNDVANTLRYIELLELSGGKDNALRELHNLIQELKRKGRFKDLALVYERLYKLDPERIDLCKELAKIYLKLDQPKKALLKLQVAFNNDREDPKTLNLLAQAFVQLNQIEKAKSVYLELIKLYNRTNQQKEKERVYNKLIELLPEEEEVSKSFVEFRKNYRRQDENNDPGTVPEFGDRKDDRDHSCTYSPKSIDDHFNGPILYKVQGGPRLHLLFVWFKFADLTPAKRHAALRESK